MTDLYALFGIEICEAHEAQFTQVLGELEKAGGNDPPPDSNQEASTIYSTSRIATDHGLGSK